MNELSNMDKTQALLAICWCPLCRVHYDDGVVRELPHREIAKVIQQAPDNWRFTFFGDSVLVSSIPQKMKRTIPPKGKTA